MAAPAVPLIASPSNPRIKAATRLREPRERSATGLTLVDGAREVRRALDAGVEMVEVFICEPQLAGPDARAALDLLLAAGMPIQPVTETAMAKLAFGDRHEGILAVIRAPSQALDALELPAAPLVVVVDGVEKPGNLGAILRSADGAGADAVIAASPRTDLANPNVIRASAGTVFALPTAAASTEDVLAFLRQRGIRPIAARVDATQPYTEADLTGAVAIVLGTEAEGLGAAWSGDDIEAVRLPMHGIADSLNVSVTAAILLYEARRQRDRQTGGSD